MGQPPDRDRRLQTARPRFDQPDRAAAKVLVHNTSTGASLVAAIELGKRLGPNAVIVTVLCDAGMKYLSTPLYGAQG